MIEVPVVFKVIKAAHSAWRFKKNRDTKREINTTKQALSETKQALSDTKQEYSANLSQLEQKLATTSHLVAVHQERNQRLTVFGVAMSVLVVVLLGIVAWLTWLRG